MPFVLEPLVGGELGPDTVLDPATHPPGVNRAQFVLDTPTTADLMESFPIYLVSEALAGQLTAAGLRGFRLDDAEVLVSENYKDLRLCVSDRMMAVLERADLRGCDIEALD